MFWTNIVWPVWKIRAYSRLWTVDGITYIDSYFNKGKVLDNKNLTGSFMDRRLKIQDPYPLNIYYMSLDELFQEKKGVFIDSSGLVFKMTPTTFVKVTAHKVLEVRKVGNFTYFLFFEGIFTPIEYNSTEDISSQSITWAYLIYSNKSYIIYSLLKEEPQIKKMRRKVA